MNSIHVHEQHGNPVYTTLNYDADANQVIAGEENVVMMAGAAHPTFHDDCGKVDIVRVGAVLVVKEVLANPDGIGESSSYLIAVDPIMLQIATICIPGSIPYSQLSKSAIPAQWLKSYPSLIMKIIQTLFKSRVSTYHRHEQDKQQDKDLHSKEYSYVVHQTSIRDHIRLVYT